jgi:hypothetical protein
MLIHPMLDQLTQLGLSGMAQAFAELEALNRCVPHAPKTMRKPQTDLVSRSSFCNSLRGGQHGAGFPGLRRLAMH